MVVLCERVVVIAVVVEVVAVVVVGKDISTHFISAGLTKPMPQLKVSQQNTENTSTTFPFLNLSATTPQNGALQNSMK